MYTTKTCATCASTLFGRKDKVFCGKNCQNKHHAIAKLSTPSIQKKRYNKRIKRNYIVLRGILSVNSSTVIIDKNNLFNYGFDLSFFLSRIKRNGIYIYRIKEFEFRPIGHGKIEIRRIRKGTPYLQEFIERWKREFPLIYDRKLVEFKGGIWFYFERVAIYSKHCLVANTPLYLTSKYNLSIE